MCKEFGRRTGFTNLLVSPRSDELERVAEGNFGLAEMREAFHVQNGRRRSHVLDHLTNDVGFVPADGVDRGFLGVVAREPLEDCLKSSTDFLHLDPLIGRELRSFFDESCVESFEPKQIHFNRKAQGEESQSLVHPRGDDPSLFRRTF